MPGVDRINAGLRRVPPWTLYGAGAALPVWLFWAATTGGLGVDPVREATLRLVAGSHLWSREVLPTRWLYELEGSKR